MTRRPSALAILTGVALVLLPFIGLGFKLVSAGWLLIALLYGLAFLGLGTLLQIVIAATGFFWPGGPVQSTSVRLRATIAAWATSIAWVLLCVFIEDTGDTDYGSTFQVWLGVYGDDGDSVHAATDGLTSVVAVIAGIVWIAAFLWLVIEWIVGWVLRGRARRATMPPPFLPGGPSGPDGLTELFTKAP